MGNHKVADALLAFHHLTNINRLIAGQVSVATLPVA
jgi:hypothetical protein